jgi:hypothetical protein
VPKGLLNRAAQHLSQKNVLSVLCLIGNHSALEFVQQNVQPLKADGVFEFALVNAFTACRVNNHSWPMPVLRNLFFTAADRQKLRLIGPPLPNAGPFRLYRGVAGRGKARRTAGISWTANPNAACWFAMRFAEFLDDPAVYEYLADQSEVLCRYSDRNEDEYLLDVRQPKRVERMALSIAEMQQRAAQWKHEVCTQAMPGEAESG